MNVDIAHRAWEIARNLIEIGLLAIPIYALLRFLRGTRAFAAILGIGIVIVLAFVLSQQLDLAVIEWLLTKVPSLIAITLIIIFQPELRRFFAEIGVNPQRLLASEDKAGAETVEILIESAMRMAATRTGALIAIERSIGMRSYIESGVPLNAKLSSDLVQTVFDTKTPLHDGGLVIKNGIIVAAGCVFPLSEMRLERALGTRHRAAIGITEETDCVTLVVSEERGWVSLAHRGVLVENLEVDRLRRHLTRYLVKRKVRADTRTRTIRIQTVEEEDE
jgi:diadenylate cyclase